MFSWVSQLAAAVSLRSRSWLLQVRQADANAVTCKVQKNLLLLYLLVPSARFSIVQLCNISIVSFTRRANNCPIAAGCVMSIHLPYNCPFGTVTYIFVTQLEKKA